MLLSILLILIVALFAVGFLWPVLWFPAIALLVLWIAAMIFWGASGRRGDKSVEGERPTHRIE